MWCWFWPEKLLDDARHEAWVQHVKGATSLVEIRGPEGYETDFEKALFLAQMGPIVISPLKSAVWLMVNWQRFYSTRKPWSILLYASLRPRRGRIYYNQLWTGLFIQSLCLPIVATSSSACGHISGLYPISLTMYKISLSTKGNLHPTYSHSYWVEYSRFVQSSLDGEVDSRHCFSHRIPLYHQITLDSTSGVKR